jgi:exopolysaccharide biosynthesis polyprenyl glycosylphosphotransferase
MSVHRNYLYRQAVWLGTLDALCLLVGIAAGVELRLGHEALDAYVVQYFSGWVYLALAVIVSNYVTGSYGLELRLSRFNMGVNWAFSIVAALLVVSITSYAWFDAVLGRGVLLLSLTVYSFLWLALRLLIYRYVFTTDAFAYRVVIVGTGPRAKAELEVVENVNLRPSHKVVALLRVERDPDGHKSVIGDVQGVTVIRCGPAHLAATISSLGASVVLLAPEQEEELAGVYPQLRRLRFEGVPVLTPLNVAETYSGKVPLNMVDESWLMHASQGFIAPMMLRFKRVCDVVLALMAMPAGLLLGALTAVAIKSGAPFSPVFYSQERVGRFGVVFRIYKFRTMTPNAEQEGAVWAQRRDPRVTGVGRWLRKFRLDELPQLWNVLKGDMSLVGPRPERPELVEKLAKVIPYYRERENILPGLTGWAQIRYPYGATIEDARAKLEFDLYYLQNMSIGLDLRIILRTIRIVLFGLERETR